MFSSATLNGGYIWIQTMLELGKYGRKIGKLAIKFGKIETFSFD